MVGLALRRWFLPVAMTAVLGALATPAPAQPAAARHPAHGAATRVYVPIAPERCGGPPQHRPSKIITACTAPAEWLDGLSWSSFDGAQAHGTGKYHYSTCTPT